MKDLSESYSGTKKEIFYVENDKKDDCNCTTQPEKKQSKIKNEQQIQTMIEFENNLQNIIYVKVYVLPFLLFFIYKNHLHKDNFIF